MPNRILRCSTRPQLGHGESRDDCRLPRVCHLASIGYSADPNIAPSDKRFVVGEAPVEASFTRGSFACVGTWLGIPALTSTHQASAKARPSGLDRDGPRPRVPVR
jgi:hypothetical protein